MKEILYRCPLCQGTGKIVSHYIQYPPEIRAKARKLYRQGIGLREIGRRLKINHPQKVYSLIMAKSI